MSFTAIAGLGGGSDTVTVDGKAEFEADAALGAAGTYFDLLTEGTTPGVSGNTSPSGWKFTWSGATPSLLRITDTGQLRHTWTAASAAKEVFAVRYVPLLVAVQDLTNVFARWKPKYSPIAADPPPNLTNHGIRLYAWDPVGGFGTYGTFPIVHTANKMYGSMPNGTYYQGNSGAAGTWFVDYQVALRMDPGGFAYLDDRAGSLQSVSDAYYGNTPAPTGSVRGWWSTTETWLAIRMFFASGAATTSICDGGWEAPVMSFR